jgi:hypothetical protein
LGAKVPPWLQRELIQSNDVDPSDGNEVDCTSEHSDNDDISSSTVENCATKIQVNADLLKSGTRWISLKTK